MIRLIKGSVVDIGLTFTVVETGGIGYLIHTNVNGSQFILGETVVFHTYLAVRENSLDLYGFLQRDELEIFELLISLPKIGPKSAIQILSQADITLLKEAVRNNDPGYLSKLSGIGKKSAEKIVSGLRDKFDEDDTTAFMSPNGGDGVAAHATDTIDALITLGYPQLEARKIMVRISSEYPDINNSADALKLALQLLSK